MIYKRQHPSHLVLTLCKGHSNSLEPTRSLVLGRLSQEDCCKFEASLDCIERFRPAQKTECGLILKKEKKKKWCQKKKK